MRANMCVFCVCLETDRQVLLPACFLISKLFMKFAYDALLKFRVTFCYFYIFSFKSLNENQQRYELILLCK